MERGIMFLVYLSVKYTALLPTVKVQLLYYKRLWTKMLRYIQYKHLYIYFVQWGQFSF